MEVKYSRSDFDIFKIKVFHTQIQTKSSLNILTKDLNG